MQEQEARTNLAHARADADRGLFLERSSRVHENEALAEERRAQAEKDNELALLNFVKALKEIEGVDLDHLGKLITLSNVLKQEQRIANVKDEIEQTPAAQPQGFEQPQQNTTPAQNVSA
jgi:hypothetical protein